MLLVNKAKNTLLSKQLLYMICFFLLMIIDWTRGSQVGSTWAWTVNMTGVIMAVIMFSSYSIREFNKPVYIVYSLLGVIALPLSYLWWNAHQAIIYRDKLLTAVLNVWLLGVLLIKLIDDVVIQKRKKLHFAKLEIAFVAMLLWMFFSVNEDVWPIWYLIMFELFYHTDYSSEDMKSMKQGLLNGIILAFFVLQGFAFVFRPFDDPHYRYCGIYANCNMNALFYCIVLVAFLLKLFYARKNKEKKILILIYALFAGALLGFLVLTITRTAWITATVLLFFYMILSEIVLLKRKGLSVALSVVTLMLIAGLSVPIEYMAVRYLPPVFHHPVWFEGEYSEDKIHSWDPVDSEKYVSYDEFTNAVWDRVEPYTNLIWQKMIVNAQEIDVQQIQKVDYENDTEYSSARGRFFIWKHYLRNGTLMGHSETEGHIIDGVETYVWHTQNMFVQFWYYYGIPSAILLVVVMMWLFYSGTKKILEEKTDAIISVLYIALIILYGLFEATWYPGQMVLLLAFYTPVFMMRKDIRNA